MRGLFNDLLRSLIAVAIWAFGLLMTLVQRTRLRHFRKNQQRLARRYRITPHTPVLSYEYQEKSTQQTAAQLGRTKKVAMTSGSTGEPKRVAYTSARLRRVKFAFSDMFARACWSLKLRRTSLYVFSSFTTDQSLTSLLLNESRLPSYLSTLQAPYRVQQQPEIRRLVKDYGPTAVRLWILAIANPAVLYSTNPSTISSFLDELTANWSTSSQLIRDWWNNPERFDPIVHKIAHRLASTGSKDRLRQIARSNEPLTLESCEPAIQSYICWTGGYVEPFLKRVAMHLPSPRYRLIPMYSMSTETVETVSYFRGTQVYFLPMSSGVLYEFIELNKQDLPTNLLQPHQLQTEGVYAMVVSDQYGLRRYQTGDLFTCAGKIGPLPDLRFLRRRELEYSFTGEKLTSQQVSIAFDRLRICFPALTSNIFLACVPSLSTNGNLPHYQVLLVGSESTTNFETISKKCDELLRQINCEYDSKRASGRLGQVTATSVSIDDFTSRMTGGTGWESQFKFLPLYRQLWDASPPAAL